MRTENHVMCPQMRTHSHGDGFLTDVCVASPVDQPALMAARQLLLTLPDELHCAIPRKHLLFGRGHYCPPFAEVGPTEPALFMARLPPSIGISAPVIQLALSEGKKDGEAFDVVWMTQAACRDATEVSSLSGLGLPLCVPRERD
jgi:hypothetical protein